MSQTDSKAGLQVFDELMNLELILTKESILLSKKLYESHSFHKFA